MHPYKRKDRVNLLVKQEVADIIANRIKDPRLGFVTVVDVQLTVDMKLARVYVSVLKDEEREPSMLALVHSQAFVHSELMRRLKMKVVPHVEFKLDTTAQYGMHIEALFKEIKEQDEHR